MRKKSLSDSDKERIKSLTKKMNDLKKGSWEREVIARKIVNIKFNKSGKFTE